MLLHAPTSAFIFLHGSGDIGLGLQAWVHDVSPNFDANLAARGVAVVYPSATPRAYTLAGGQTSSVWFDRVDLEWGSGVDEQSVSASCELVGQAVAQASERWGLPRHRIFVGGFSMGGSMALHYALRVCCEHDTLATSPPLPDQRLGGVAMLSNYLPRCSPHWGSCLGVTWHLEGGHHGGGIGGGEDRAPFQGPAPYQDAARWTPAPSQDPDTAAPLLRLRRVPVLVSHGESDRLIPCPWGAATARGLAAAGLDVTWASHPGVAHCPSLQALDTLLAWLDAQLARTAPPT